MSISPKYTLKPVLSEKFSGIIWKIETDESQKLIAVETRNAESHTVHYSVYNYHTGECLIKEISPESGWWWNLDRIYSGILLLHGYVTESSPEHKGIIALDISTGNVKWQAHHLSLHDISEEGLVVYNPLLQSKKLMLLSAETGDVLLHSVAAYLPLRQDIVLPQAYSQTLPRPGFFPDNIYGPILYHKKEEKEAWSFHIKNNIGFTQYLIITQNREIILSDILASDIPKLNPEAFFLQHEHIFAVKGNNSEFVAYLL